MIFSYNTREKWKLYYFMPSYWKRGLRRCDFCGKRKKVNYSTAFEEPKKYYHEFCHPAWRKGEKR